MLNRVSIMGRLVRDPELRRTQSGIAVTTMRIAVERDFKSQDGTRQSDFFDVVAWRNTAEFVSRYFAKGRMMVVDGRLQTREWTDRDNNRRTSVEIVAENIYFGDSRRDGEYTGGAPSGGYGSNASGGYGAPSGGYGSGGYGAPSGGYGSGYASGGYGASSGGYGSGYGASSGGYGSGASGGYGAPSGGYGSGYGAPSGGYGSGYGASSGGYGSGYGAPSGGYGSGGYDNRAANVGDADNASSSGDAAPVDQSPAPDAEKKPDNANSSFADMSDDDADLPF